MELAQIEQLIAERGIEVVKVGGADMDGVYRGKRLLASHFLAGCREGGFPQCDVIFGWDIAERIIELMIEREFERRVAAGEIVARVGDDGETYYERADN